MALTEITEVAQLEALIGTPIARVRDKLRPALHEVDRDWLAASPFCLVATAAADGSCDVSPKGDPAGQLAYVIDDRTIAVAERPGNRRVDGYRNILSNPNVGLIFLIPGRDDTLRINGRARLVADTGPAADGDDLFARMEVKGHRPVLLLMVDIEEVFHHCAKAFLRSRLWDHEAWTDQVPSRAEIAKTLERPEASMEELKTYYGEQYRTRLYTSQ